MPIYIQIQLYQNTYINRAYTLSSSYFSLHREIEFLKDYFQKNNYPLDKYFSIVKSFLHNKFFTKPNFHITPKLVKYIKLPFYGNPSYDCRKRLLKLLRFSFPGIDHRVIFTNDFKISSFLNIKDKTPDHISSNLMYQFNCPSCESGYIGCTT